MREKKRERSTRERESVAEGERDMYNMMIVSITCGSFLFVCVISALLEYKHVTNMFTIKSSTFS